MNTDKITKNGAEAIAGLIPALSGLTDQPVLVAGGALIAPLIKDQITEFLQWSLGCIQRKKVIKAADITCKTIVENINNNKRIREDDFFKIRHNSILDTNESSASKLLEGSLLKAKEEYDSKKIPFLSFLTANIYFAPYISESKAFVLLEVLSKLSYRQLCALAIFDKRNILPVGKWESRFKGVTSLQNYYDVFYEFLSLKDCLLIEQNMPGGGMSMGISDYRISALGKELVITANLSAIQQQDLKALECKVDFINASLQ